MSVVSGDNWGTPVSTRIRELLSSDLLPLLSNLLSHLVGYSLTLFRGLSFLLLVAMVSNN